MLDLFVAAGGDPELYVAYSRRKEHYVPALRRYVHPVVTHTAVCTVADLLADAGYADAKAGSYRRELLGARGYRSRLRATDKLVDFLASRGVTLADVGTLEGAELIRLKGPTGPGGREPMIGYARFGESTKRMQEDLRAWAAVTNRHHIRPPDGARRANDRAEVDEDDGAGEHGLAAYPPPPRVQRRALGCRMSFLRRLVAADVEPSAQADQNRRGAGRRTGLQGSAPAAPIYHLRGSRSRATMTRTTSTLRWTQVDRGDLKVAFNKLLAVGFKGRGQAQGPRPLPRALVPALLWPAGEASTHRRLAPRQARRGPAVPGQLHRRQRSSATSLRGSAGAAPSTTASSPPSGTSSSPGERSCTWRTGRPCKDLSGSKAWPVVKGLDARCGD